MPMALPTSSSPACEMDWDQELAGAFLGPIAGHEPGSEALEGHGSCPAAAAVRAARSGSGSGSDGLSLPTLQPGEPQGPLSTPACSGDSAAGFALPAGSDAFPLHHLEHPLSEAGTCGVEAFGSSLTTAGSLQHTLTHQGSCPSPLECAALQPGSSLAPTPMLLDSQASISQLGLDAAAQMVHLEEEGGTTLGCLPFHMGMPGPLGYPMYGPFGPDAGFLGMTMTPPAFGAVGGYGVDGPGMGPGLAAAVKQESAEDEIKAGPKERAACGGPLGSGKPALLLDCSGVLRCGSRCLCRDCALAHECRLPAGQCLPLTRSCLMLLNILSCTLCACSALTVGPSPAVAQRQAALAILPSVPDQPPRSCLPQHLNEQPLPMQGLGGAGCGACHWQQC